MVQGPGGNTSFKNEETMWVKASGKRLSDAETQEIFVGVSVKDGNLVEPESELKPSIEKDFHLLIPFPYVIHTHSLKSLILGIAKDFGAKRKTWPEVAFINYARPGRELCTLISQNIDFYIHKAAILQNHGFITWGDTLEEAYSRLVQFESDLEIQVVADKFSNLEPSPIEHPRAITPDYAVFLSPHKESEILKFEGKDLWKKQMYLIAQHACAFAKRESEINYLAENEVESLQNWDAERFRLVANK